MKLRLRKVLQVMGLVKKRKPLRKRLIKNNYGTVIYQEPDGLGEILTIRVY
jgi:hypothetical protein